MTPSEETHTLEAEISELAKEWYHLIGPQHHKDRDCHWRIVTRWSYGDPATYSVEHNGYILCDIQIPCASYFEALSKLKTKLKQSIEQEKEFQEYTKKESDEALRLKISEE